MEQKKVYAAISAVARDMAEVGISKDRENRQQGFSFRGIDQVYNALAPMLAKHGLVILPRITERTVTERVTQKGGVLFYVVVKAEFDFVATEDGSMHTIVTYGEAMDSGDKATNKAMSIAYKYAAFQTFCIPTEQTAIDADAEVHHITPQAAEDALKEFGDKASLAQSVAELQAAYKEVWPKLGNSKEHEARAQETYKTRGKELQQQTQAA
ncbi:ERF family protein [Citrobacter portucalensis]|uniref:ERF family protein n=1 Tax=Citrobacter portucalensis TaxID=1639133 RepID=UPI00177D71BC|nr:ERF family protein [Citrobacter portucalensis]MBD9984555.1 single-stranded DNA-binding protein [Citrobacter portucalensis]MBE0031867.1 single-stranded DNA-binding protein [Citrobacter portucalensis]MBE0039888.1 single-stranded DNA-binding protein [Citrobacter portucalensis]MBE0046842.1 single-stranded DNA-binding protein [Citrobacter portucalensis]MBE0076463.1 single-stranded DNA-binding protein [Citrobacter portucalensis]